MGYYFLIEGMYDLGKKKWTQDFTKLNNCLKNANNHLNLTPNILYDLQVDLLQLASSGAPIGRGYLSMVE